MSSKLEKLRVLVASLQARNEVRLPHFQVWDEQEFEKIMNRQRYYQAVQDSWYYYYLPLGHVFGYTAPGANTPIWTTSSQISIKRLGTDAIFTLNGTPSEINAVDQNCIALADIFTELLYFSNTAIYRVNSLRGSLRAPGPRRMRLKLSAFRHSPQSVNENPNLVSMDVLSAHYFTSECQPIAVGLVPGEGSVRRYKLPETERKGSNWYGCVPPATEYGGAKFFYSGHNSHEGPSNRQCLLSLACFPAFYDDYRCNGVVLTDRENNLWEFNSSPFAEYSQANATQPESRVGDCLLHGVLPVAHAVLKSGTFGYAFKILVMFGARIQEDTEETIFADRPLTVSVAFFTLGLNCETIVAKEIAREISYGIKALQSELFAATARQSTSELEDKKSELQDKNSELEVKNSQLERGKQLLDLVRRPLESLSTQLNSAQQEITQLHGIFNAPHRGVYARASRMQEFFNDADIHVFGFALKTGHNPAELVTLNPDIEKRLINHFSVAGGVSEIVLVAMIRSFMGGRFAKEADLAHFGKAIDELGDSERMDSDLNASLKWLVLNSLALGEPRVRNHCDALPYDRILSDFKLVFLTLFKPLNSKEPIYLNFLKAAFPQLVSPTEWIHTVVVDSKVARVLIPKGVWVPFPTAADFLEIICAIATIGGKSKTGENLSLTAKPTSVIVNSLKNNKRQNFLNMDKLRATDSWSLLCSNEHLRWLAVLGDGAKGDFTSPIYRAIKHGMGLSGVTITTGESDRAIWIAWKYERKSDKIDTSHNFRITLAEDHFSYTWSDSNG